MLLSLCTFLSCLKNKLSYLKNKFLLERFLHRFAIFVDSNFTTIFCKTMLSPFFIISHCWRRWCIGDKMFDVWHYYHVTKCWHLTHWKKLLGEASCVELSSYHLHLVNLKVLLFPNLKYEFARSLALVVLSSEANTLMYILS